MAKSVRGRQSSQQTLIIALGAGLILLVVLVGAASMIQGNRQTTASGPIETILAANLSAQYFVVDSTRVIGDSIHVVGHYGGVAQDRPTTQEQWSQLTTNVANRLAGMLRGMGSTLTVEYYDRGQLVGQAQASIR